MYGCVFFKKEIESVLEGYSFQYGFYLDGDFGDLERVEFEGNNKIGTVDFWSKGWLSLDVFDIKLDKQLINLLLEPNDDQQKQWKL
ncbi:hypothetical protein CWS02_00275 [Enterobacter sp. EA-1]|nr:hypothetical protein CWS02_00275 [Enterobacter sp. EA-1]